MPLRVMPILQFFRPGHPNGNIFENRVAIRNCHWFVDVADDVEVHITFDTQFGIETEENGAQCYDFMTINPDLAERVVYCGNSYQQDAVFYSKDQGCPGPDFPRYLCHWFPWGLVLHKNRFNF